MAKGNASKTSSPSAEDKRWQARMDADTLRSAGEIMNDTSRVRAVQSELNRGLAAIQKISKVSTRHAKKR